MNATLPDSTGSVKMEAELPLAGLRVAFVGKLGGHTRREAHQLVREFGGIPLVLDEGPVDLVVVGAEELPVHPDSHLDDDTLRLGAEGKLEIIGETQLWQRLGLLEAESHVRRLYTPMMLSELLRVKVSAIRRWFRLGLIVPAREVNQLPYFDFQEIAVARQLAQLVAAGVSVGQIQHKLAQLASFLPNAERPLAQLSILIEGKQILLRDGSGLVEAGGQRRIDFESLEVTHAELEASPTIEFTDPTTGLARQLRSLEDYLEQAIQHEDNDQVEQAIRVYRAALLEFGVNAEICFRLGELFSLMNQIEAARERYFMAIELDAKYIEARANLGCALVELGQLDEAIETFEATLAFHEDYPDVHFHLARVFDDRGDTVHAETHWQRFLELAPESPWADEARIRLTRLN